MKSTLTAMLASVALVSVPAIAQDAGQAGKATQKAAAKAAKKADKAAQKAVKAADKSATESAEALTAETDASAEVSAETPAADADAAVTAEAEVAPEPKELTPELAAAYNKAVADFQAAQGLQQAGDHAGVIAKMEGALPPIHDMTLVEPDNVQHKAFYANALMLLGNSEGANGNLVAVEELYAEALPYWQAVYDSNKGDTNVRDTLLGVLINLGNIRLAPDIEDKEGAKASYEQALALAREGRQTDAENAVLVNTEFSSLVGLWQISQDASILEEAKPVAELLRSKGLANAVNKPSVDSLLGSAG